MEKTTLSHIKNLLKPRISASNKTTYGHAFIVAGNKGKMGAAILASRACLRSGVGLLTTCIPESEREIIQTAVPEAMISFRGAASLDKVTAVGVGPGMGIEKDSDAFLAHLLDLSNLPLVLDADALTLLSKNQILWEKLPKNAILTPHQGEFDRLFGHHANQAERMRTAERIAKERNCILVMKGAKTAIVTKDQIFENQTGNVGLAKGGSGDVLTGIICAFLAQGYSPSEAARIGVFLHGYAADLCLVKQCVESMLASDVIEKLGAAFKIIHEAKNMK